MEIEDSTAVVDDFAEIEPVPSGGDGRSGKDEVIDEKLSEEVLEEPGDDALVLERLVAHAEGTAKEESVATTAGEDTRVPTHELRPKCAQCKKTAGQPNALDDEFLAELRRRFRDSPQNLRMQFWFSPPRSYKVSTGLPLADFCVKRVFVWRPDVQFAGSPIVLKCGKCTKLCEFKHKDYLTPRYTHTLEGGVLVLMSRLCCCDCGDRVSSIDDGFFDQCPLWKSLFPFYFTHQSGFHEDFLSHYLNLYTAGTSITCMVKAIARFRHTRYLRQRLLYYRALRVTKANPFTKQAVQPLPFPALGDHCNGYNEILAPSENLLQDALVAYSRNAQISLYTGRFMGGLKARAVCSDQHHAVPKRVVFADPNTRRKVHPYPGILGVVNEYGQMLLYYWTMTTASGELVHSSKQLSERLRDSPPIIWTTDRCCLGVRHRLGTLRTSLV